MTTSAAGPVDSYTGHVDPGGLPATRTLPEVTITKVSVGPMDNNAYLLTCKNTGEVVLIDAANDADRLLELVGAAGPLRAIVTTHAHRDHWQALEALRAATGATLHAGAEDADAIPVATLVRLEHGDVVQLGDCSLEVISLRGHTPGSVALLYRDPQGHPHLFTGDSLFPGGPGKTSGAKEFSSLMDDLENRIFAALPDDTWVYPGHGDDTTLGAERSQIDQWRRRGW